MLRIYKFGLNRMVRIHKFDLKRTIPKWLVNMNIIQELKVKDMMATSSTH